MNGKDMILNLKSETKVLKFRVYVADMKCLCSRTGGFCRFMAIVWFCACIYSHTPNGIINAVYVLTSHLSCKKNDPTKKVESVGGRWRGSNVKASAFSSLRVGVVSSMRSNPNQNPRH